MTAVAALGALAYSLEGAGAPLRNQITVVYRRIGRTLPLDASLVFTTEPITELTASLNERHSLTSDATQHLLTGFDERDSTRRNSA